MRKIKCKMLNFAPRLPKTTFLHLTVEKFMYKNGLSQQMASTIDRSI